MVKRKRAKASTAAKKKVNDKKKDVKPLKLEKTTSENASVSRLQESDESSSSAKKAKLDPCQSPSPTKSKKYVPPFTASQRVSLRSRKSRINSEKSEKKQSCENETKVCLEGEDVFKTVQAKANSPERSRKEVSEEVLESNEDKTDEKLSETTADVQQSDVEMKIEVIQGIIEEKDNKTDAEIAVDNASETAQKETGVEVQSLENSINKSKDENSATPEEVREKNGLEVREVSGVTKAIHHQSELNGGCKEETRTDENLIGNKRENLEEGVAEELEKGVDAHMSVVIGSERDHVETEVTIGESDVSTRVDNVEARIGHFDARLSDVGGKINTVASVPFLADVCAGNKYVGVIVEKPGTSESCQNEVQKKTAECEPKMNGTHKEGEDDSNVNNEQGLAEEKNPNKNNVIPEPRPELPPQHGVADLDVTNKPITLCEERTMDNLGHIQIPSSNEFDDVKAQKNLEPVQNEHMNKPSLSCQENIEDKPSEMLAIVTESNSLPSSKINNKNNTNSSPTVESNEKSLDDPIHSATVAEAESTSAENAREKYPFDSQKKKCLTESVVSNEDFVNSDKNSLDSVKIQPSVIAMSVESECVSAVVEKVKDVRDTPRSVDENSDKSSKNAARTEIIEMKECQGETMTVDNECGQVNIEKVEDVENSEKSDKNALNTSITERESKVPSSERSETMDRVGNSADKITDALVANDKVAHENDQEVPSKMSISPKQEVPDETVSKIELKDENKAVACSHNEATSVLTSTKNSTADISRETTEKAVDAITSCNVDEQSYTEEFRALEELLPADDIGLFDDVMMSQPKSTSVNDELPSGDSTVEFLINELKSLHCMVASYERTVRDVKRQYNSNSRF